MSEMTTAEMVAWCKASATKEPNPMAAMCFTEIAARLSALDKVAKAAVPVVRQLELSSVFADKRATLQAALKEAGYGE